MSDSQLPFYMRDNFAPVEKEVSSTQLQVQGWIPEDLSGRYLRNGPNPIGGDPGHWFFGDGMIHGVRIEEGRALWYRNRYVETRRFKGEEVSLVSEEGVVDYTASQSNTNVVSHAGHILALVETGFPMELTPELETVGPYDFGGKLQASFTAHPKICASTGEMLAFGYGFFPPFVTFHRISAAGELLQSEAIDVPGATMMHDFAITDRHVIFMDLPIVFNPEGVGSGMPYRWCPDYGARLGVMPRGGGNADVTWYEIDPCYVFHPLNAYEDGSKIVLDVVRYASLMASSEMEEEGARLTRWTIDREAGSVHEQRLDDRNVEFPRVDPRCEGLRNRYGYLVSSKSGAVISPDALLKYDLEAGSCEVHDFGPGSEPGEALFVPAASGNGEDDGYVMGYVYSAERDSSELVILDAKNFGDEPLARIAMPQRVPHGFHGSWVPDLI
jgi:carotenoid cleavage dioxygenase-like enzyme